MEGIVVSQNDQQCIERFKQYFYVHILNSIERLSRKQTIIREIKSKSGKTVKFIDEAMDQAKNLLFTGD